MTGRVFLNYRRGDEPGFAGRLFDRLEQAFTAERLFMDVDHIGPGEDFVRVLEDEVGKCDVLLAIIGKGWINATDELGQRRLESPNDFVRIEIESALRQGKRIVPVLINEAQMPRAEDLPDSLKPLSRRNAVRLTHERFKSDAQGLVQILEKALSEVEAARALKDEAERRAAEEALRRKQEEEASRAAEAERQAQIRAREQASLGLSAAEISKAEELANWDFIKGANDATELRNHLARFPGGVTERYARTALEEIVWRDVGASKDVAQLQSFVDEFPEGRQASVALAQLTNLRKEAEHKQERAALERLELKQWSAVSSSNSPEDFKNFLQKWPNGQFSRSASKRLRAIQKAQITGPSTTMVVTMFFLIGIVGGLMLGSDTFTTFELFGYSSNLSFVFLAAALTMFICVFSSGISWLLTIGLIASAIILSLLTDALALKTLDLLPRPAALTLYGSLSSIPMILVLLFCYPDARSWRHASTASLISGIASAVGYALDANGDMYFSNPTAAAISWGPFTAYLGYMLTLNRSKSATT